MQQPQRDIQTVTPDGETVQTLIDGVQIINAVTHTDGRGTLCEISNLALKAHGAPLVYVYQFTIRPGKIKGWHIHYLHDDRVFLSRGEVKVVLYDNRPDSPTYQQINEIHLSELHRTLMVIPTNVYHALQNIGDKEALFVSMPTRAYDHESPDVYRLPVENETIPYQFEDLMGW